MSELEVIDALCPLPNTLDSISNDLRTLGVREGMTLIVHSSLSSLGWVCGGAVTVILSLESVLGRQGTLVMPAHSGDLSDPALWRNPPVPREWWQTIRDTMPAFDKDMTPTRGMGSIPETFRKQKGVLRSEHPTTSFAAWGRHSWSMVKSQHLDNSMDSQSPLGRIYDQSGYVLLLGVGHDSNTSIHLAEYAAEHEGKRTIDCYSPMRIKGRRVWKRYRDLDFLWDDFDRIGKDFEDANERSFVKGKVGHAEATLIRQRDLVDFSTKWMEKNRGRSASPA